MAEVTGTVTTQFDAPRIICPLDDTHGYINPIEEEWLQHFCLGEVPLHGGNPVPTAMPHIEVSGTATAKASGKYQCRIPGCTAYFPTAALLGDHLCNDHGCAA